MISIKRAFELNRDFIPDIIDLDAKSYAKELQGTYESVRARYEANKDSYILLMDYDRIAGYACYFPVSQEFSDNIVKGIKTYDDNIRPEDIIMPDKDTPYDIFLISIVVSSELRGKGYSKLLIDALHNEIENGQRKGLKIRKVYAEAFTEKGKHLLISDGFNPILTINNVVLMEYVLDDYKDTNLYIFVPFIKNKDFKLGLLNEHDNNGFIGKLNYTAKNEFQNGLPERLKRYYVGSPDIIAVNDSDEIITGRKQCGIYLSCYNDYCTAILVINGLGFEPTDILNQVSADNLYIADNSGKVLLKDYLAAYGLIQSGLGKSVVCLGKIPTNLYLTYLLAGEAYTNSYVDVRIISREYAEKAEKSIAQYDFSSIYASEKNVVFAHSSKVSDTNRKQELELLMVFIMELLMLQISAVSSNYNTVSDCLDGQKMDETKIEKVYLDFTGAVKLWDINNFKFSLAKLLTDKISNEFQIEEQKKDYYNNLKILEKLTNMKSQKVVEAYSKSTGKYFTIFTLLSGFNTLSVILGLIFTIFKCDNELFEAWLTAVSGILCILTFIAISFYFKKIKGKNINLLEYISRKLLKKSEKSD